MSSLNVFISYSHDSRDHADNVLMLADQLRADGIEAIIDQYDNVPAEGWPIWMSNCVQNADYILVVCSSVYLARCKRQEKKGAGKGVKWESLLLYQQLYDADSSNMSLIPILLNEESASNIPEPLRAFTHFRLDAADFSLETDSGYESLYRYLTNQPLVERPQLGSLKSLPSKKRKRMYARLSSKSKELKETESDTSSTALVRAQRRRAVFARLPVQGFLAFDDLENPYANVHDATDSAFEVPKIHCFAWFPHTQYIASQPIMQEYTPVAIVCCVDPKIVIRKLTNEFGGEILTTYNIAPRNLRNEEKELLMKGMNSILDECFEIAVTFPKSHLAVGRSQPKLAYSVMTNGFLLPFVQMHQRLGYRHLDFQISKIGAEEKNLFKLVKRVFSGCYSDGSYHAEIQFMKNEAVSETMFSIARLFAWAVARLHNSADSKWVSFLETGEKKN